MTRKEIAEYLGIGLDSVSDAINEIIRANPKYFKGSIHGKSFRSSQILEICSHINGVNELHLQILKEKLKDPETNRIIYIDGNEKFIEMQSKNKKIRACGNCSFCIGKSMVGKTSALYPYCSFYERFIHSLRVNRNGKYFKARLFEDCCETWSRGEPRLWEINK